MKRSVLIFYKLVFAALALVAIAAQLLHSTQLANFNMVNFFSFFTIESNIFAATLFLISAYVLWAGKRNATLDYLRGAATLYMLVTGIIYTTLLASGQNTLL